ncbi:hypothetical protein IMZ48_33625 [Candidatus Bathyarchaeota archaeon]|nr:hypothetical protein [Candidatus Bathyarchaeota archaeon]
MHVQLDIYMYLSPGHPTHLHAALTPPRPSTYAPRPQSHHIKTPQDHRRQDGPPRSATHPLLLVQPPLTAPPVKDIPAVLRKVTRGTPQEQNDALKAYFLPDAALETPLLRIPPVPDVSVSYLGVVNSRRLIYVLCRLNKLLVRTLEFEIKSASESALPRMEDTCREEKQEERPLTRFTDYDQRAATLTLQTTQTTSPIFLPFHKPTTKSTLVLRLAQRSIDAHGRVLPPGGEPAPLAMGVRTRLYVSELEGHVQPSEMLKVFVPFLGASIGWAARMFVTIWLVLLGSVLVPLAGFLPEAVVKNGDAVIADKEQ